jgi:hypothetical protein
VDDLVALTLEGVELWRMDQLHLYGVSELPSASGKLSLMFGHDCGLRVRALPNAGGEAWGIGAGNAVFGSAFHEDAGQSRTAILTATALIGNPLAVLDLWDDALRDVGGSGHAWMPLPAPPQQASASRTSWALTCTGILTGAPAQFTGSSN